MVCEDDRSVPLGCASHGDMDHSESCLNIMFLQREKQQPQHYTYWLCCGKPSSKCLIHILPLLLCSMSATLSDLRLSTATARNRLLLYRYVKGLALCPRSHLSG